jgi:predicted nucleotidyltransferase component of viral defense system
VAKRGRDIGASIRARLLNVAKEKSCAFDVVLTRYVLERLLYRLSISPQRDRFALRGALLITTWFPDPHRPTRDVDMLGFGDSSSESILAAFREICAIPADDGVEFELATLTVEPIREELEYGGLRLRIRARLAGARVAAVIDVGFGDSVEPGLQEVEFPVLLNLPAPRLRAYSRETVIAEKFEAMVSLGRANSRMKDYYDIWLLSRTHPTDGERLARAFAATFERRRTELPATIPDGLSAEFGGDPDKRAQWRAFVRDLALEPGPLDTIVADLAEFLMPHAVRARLLRGAT